MLCWASLACDSFFCFNICKITWFLTRFDETPREVKYCVIIDKKTVSASAEQIEKGINDVWKLWQREFSAFYSEQGKIPAFFLLGKETLVKEECNSSTDIRFQFGHLSTIQTIELGKTKGMNLKQHIAMTVRTHYDSKMNGKGFVYIAPEQGPLMVDHPHLIDYLSNPNILRNILVHEIGHVFGVSHSVEYEHVMNPRSIVDQIGSYVSYAYDKNKSYNIFSSMFSKKIFCSTNGTYRRHG